MMIRVKMHGRKVHKVYSILINGNVAEVYANSGNDQSPCEAGQTN
jgi:hypothetical protein